MDHFPMGESQSAGHDDRRWRLLGAVALCGIVCALSFASLLRNPQLDRLAGITDEYFALGAKLRVNGTLGVAADEPSALRPPGYPAFIAAVLWLFVDAPSRLPALAFERQGRLAVEMVQALLLALSAAALYLWLAERLGLRLAWLAALAFGANPLSIALVGLLHYDVLHLFLLVAAGWVTDIGIRREAGSLPVLAAAGALWGVSNLVRPVTQLLPAFFLLALLAVLRWRWRRALLAAAALTLGLAIALVPWTLRNLRVTGRVVPVADNPWSAVWAQSVRPLLPSPDRYVWFDVYFDLMAIFTRVTGAPAYDYVQQTRHNDALEREFRREALGHLSARPAVFARNVAATFWSYNVHASALLLTAYERLKSPVPGEPPGPQQYWFIRGEPRAMSRSPLARSFAAWHAAVSLLALAGLVLGVRAREPLVAVVGGVHFCIAVTHALLALHILHYYSKLPALVAAAFFALRALEPSRARETRAAAFAIAGSALGLTLWML
jgi:hypothetical protein